MARTDGPLAGVRVLDMATARGEVAGTFLADLGAEVWKVEPPGGAEARTMPPFANDDGRSLFWEATARGKRSIALDIATDAGRARVRGLAAAADVLVESGDPGEMGALGLGYAELRASNPRLIYVSITPYGQTGPRAGDPATDLTLQAAGGLVSLQGDWDRRPIPVGEPYTAAYHAGAQAAADTVIALDERERSGLGQHLDVSMQAAIVWILMNATGFPPNEGRDPPGYGDDRGQQPSSAGAALLEKAGIRVRIPNLWECSDGYVSALLLPSEQRAEVFASALVWAGEVGALDGHEDLLAINWKTFVPDVEQGRVDQQPLQRAMQCFEKLFRCVTKREVMERSIRDNLFFAPIYNTRDLLDDPHLQARDFWRDSGGVTHPGPFARFSATPLPDLDPAPRAVGGGEPDWDGGGETAAHPAAALGDGLRARPFEGLKVADFAWIGVGPLVAKALADHGATVVHVESETRIDSLRMGAPFKGGVQDRDLSQFFANFNSSKLSLSLNLASSEGQRIARRLIEWADVVVESFTPGTMAKLGLDYATVSAKRPDLVMFSTCLRGQTGPEAALAGYGNSGAALAGLHAVTGWPDRPPCGPWGAYTDFVTPRLGVSALTSALYHRGRTGEGQHIDVSQVECGIVFLAPEVLEYTVNGVVAPVAGDYSPHAYPNGVYRVEGIARYVALSVVTPQQWRALSELALGGRFAEPEFDGIEARRRVGDAIDAALCEWFVHRDSATAVRQLLAAGVPAAAVARPSDLHHDEQLSHRGFFTRLAHTRMGLTPYDGFVTRFSDVPSAPWAAAPCLGEHTEYVLTDLLRMEAEEIEAARAAGVLR